MSQNPLTFEEFLTRFEFQFSEAESLAYFLFTPVYSFLIIVPSVLGIYYRQKFVLAGFTFMAVFLIWAFLVMGHFLNWLDAPLEDCEFEFENLDLSICFCELYQPFKADLRSDGEPTSRENLILQPSNTMSNLAFCAAGMTCLFIASYPLNRIENNNRLTRFIKDIRNNGNPMSREASNVGLAYGLIVLFIGPASMIYHASVTVWAGVIDVVSILIWVSFCVSYSFVQIVFHNTARDNDRMTFNTQRIMSVVFLVLVVIAIIYYALTLRSSELYITYFGIFIILEVVVQYYNFRQKPLNGVKRDKFYVIAAILIMAIALGIWIPSGGVNDNLCPSYWPHAIWHSLAGLATVFIYLYFCSEVDLTEIEQGRVRARSIRTIRLQDAKFGPGFLYSRSNVVDEREQLLQDEPKKAIAPDDTEVENPTGSQAPQDSVTETGSSTVRVDLTTAAKIEAVPYTKSWRKTLETDTEEKKDDSETPGKRETVLTDLHDDETPDLG